MLLLNSDDTEACHRPFSFPEVEPDRSVLGANHPEGLMELLNIQEKHEMFALLPFSRFKRGSFVKRRVWDWESRRDHIILPHGITSREQREPHSSPCTRSWVTLHNQWIILSTSRPKRKRAAMWSHANIDSYQLLKSNFGANRFAVGTEERSLWKPCYRSSASAWSASATFLVKCIPEWKGFLSCKELW